MKAFFSYSDQFISPLFPKKGEMTVFSIVFSSNPEIVLLRADDDNGLLSTYEMRNTGTFNGYPVYQVSAPITIRDEIDNPCRDMAINQLETLARRGYFSIPFYEFNLTHDENGTPLWNCECHIDEDEV